MMNELTDNTLLKKEEDEGEKQKPIKGEDVFVQFMIKVINETSANLDEYFSLFIQDWL